MTYADELDDRDAARADLTALLNEDPPDWPAAQWCPAHGWHIPITHGCPHCTGRNLAALLHADKGTA